MKSFATYLRVSTAKQGRSGLGIDAQRKMCADFITAANANMTREFMDVESGTHRDRKGLLEAINFCKRNSCGLVIAKLDRLARDVEFCFKIVNTGVEIHFTDMPQMNTLLLGVFAAVAQYERELTSDRTKKALAAKKARGAKLGGANEKHRETMAAKTVEEKQEIQMKKGKLKTQRYLEGRDQQAFIRVLRNVFPTATKSDDLTRWRWGAINCKAPNAERMLVIMADYKALDHEGKLFAKWNFVDETASKKKLIGYLQAFRKSVLKEETN